MRAQLEKREKSRGEREKPANDKKKKKKKTNSTFSTRYLRKDGFQKLC